MRRLVIILAIVGLVASACGPLTPDSPTLTPTRALSGPTIEPSATVINFFPTEIPPNAPSGPGQNIPEAARIPADSALPPLNVTPNAEQLQRGTQPVQLTLSGGRVVVADLYVNEPLQLEQGPLRQRLPGLLLIGANPLVWDALPGQLRDFGYSVLVVDLGQAATAEDFSLAMRAFSEDENVNPGAMAALGVSDGADLAFIGCALEALCDAAVLIGPQSQATLLNVLPDYGRRPLIVFASEDDTNAFEATLALQAAAQGPFSLQAIPGDASGLALISAEPTLPEIIRQWLGQFLVV